MGMRRSWAAAILAIFAVQTMVIPAIHMTEHGDDDAVPCRACDRAEANASAFSADCPSDAPCGDASHHHHRHHSHLLIGCRTCSLLAQPLLHAGTTQRMTIPDAATTRDDAPLGLLTSVSFTPSAPRAPPATA